MDVLILSGFLGAGKTTFLQHLGKHLDDYSILENDYAKANVDSTLLASTKKNIHALEDGCICCSKKSDFAQTILTLSGGMDIPTLVIEPTGLGYLSNILENIRPILYDRIRLLEPITIVDYHFLDQTIKEYGDLFWDQVKNAGHILFSKTEHVSSAKIEDAVEKLKPHTNGKIYRDHYSTFGKEVWKNLLTPFGTKEILQSKGQTPNVDTLVFQQVSFDDFQTLGTTLQAMSEGRFGKILRGKGVCNVGQYKAKIDIVQGAWNVSPVKDLEETQVIFVGEGFDKNAFHILMNQ